MGTNSATTTGINSKPVGSASSSGNNNSLLGNLSGGLIGGLASGVINNINISSSNNNNNNNNNSNLNIMGGGGVGLGVNSSNVGTNNSNNTTNNSNGAEDGNNCVSSGGPNNQQQATPQYTIPGILHFIQHEWSRFELERSQWDVDRAELQARIAMLLGERKCLESLKSDLTRRIKMLEYALRQERAKFYRLKYGTDPPQINDLKPSSDDTSLGADVATDSEVPYSSVSNTTWRQGRQILRQYLAEIGYTDHIIDVRSNRVRSILGLNNNTEQEENVSPNINGNENNKRALDSEGGRRTPAIKTKHDAIVLDSEAAVMANFEFLGTTEMSDDDEISDDLEMVAGDNDDMEPKSAKSLKTGKDMLGEGIKKSYKHHHKKQFEKTKKKHSS